jgi:rsbT co-antagonist protein RsbR
MSCMTSLSNAGTGQIDLIQKKECTDFLMLRISSTLAHSQTMTTSITNILLNQRNEILQEWLRQQLSAENLRADLISEAELRTDSDLFLKVLSDAVQSGNLSEIRGPEYKPVLEMLQRFSRSRGRQGFTPSETATFVFSFKQPLFEALRKARERDPAELIENMWAADLLIDQLGLYTTEIYQQSREEVIRHQQEEMLELSTPVVQIWEGIVALPLIGTLDSSRTSVVMETLLQTIVETRSELAIIDITGVPTVDTLVAQHLLKTVAAARLMGADCIISGIRPQIAQTMVHLQIDLSAVTTKATMAEALRFGMMRSGRATLGILKNPSPKE